MLYIRVVWMVLLLRLLFEIWKGLLIVLLLWWMLLLLVAVVAKKLLLIICHESL